MLKSVDRVTFYSQNDVIKVHGCGSLGNGGGGGGGKYEKCDIDADLAAMINPQRRSKEQPTAAYATFSANRLTKNNKHTLCAAPRSIPLTRRDRLGDCALRKYVHGRLSVERLANALRQCGLDANAYRLIETDSTIEFDARNRVRLNVNAQQVDVVCDNDELRVKIKDSLLKCLKTL